MSDKIAIFYHIGQINNWAEIYAEQLRKMIQCGLYDATQFVFCGINGNQPLPHAPKKIVGMYNSDHVLEADTLRNVWSFSKANPGYKILYLHTKGVTWNDSDMKGQVTAWRRFMELHVIKRWKECVTLLDTYDTCGVNIRDKAHYNPGKPNYTILDAMYYDGNFWWANSDYIAKLDPEYLYTDDTPWLRGKSELWLGTGIPNAHSMCDLVYVNPYYCDYGDANEYC